MKKYEKKIKEIFEGIDKSSVSYDSGWWNDSTGAAFGKEKLNELLNYLSTLKIKY